MNRVKKTIAILFCFYAISTQAVTFNGMPNNDLPQNGLQLNGMLDNGLQLNGMLDNGLQLNGMPNNGLPQNRTSEINKNIDFVTLANKPLLQAN